MNNLVCFGICHHPKMNKKKRASLPSQFYFLGFFHKWDCVFGFLLSPKY